MEYLIHILVMVALYSILATSFNLLIGFAGLFALSHAAFYAFGAYTTAILTTQLGLPFPIPMIAGILLTATIGAAVAIPALRIGGHYLVIVTLALQVIALAVLLNWESLTGGADGIAGIPPIRILGWAARSPLDYLIISTIFACGCFWVCWRIATSPFGRALKAMRENESAVQGVAKNIVYMKVAVFAISAGLAAIAGSISAHYISFVGVESFTIEVTIYILAMVILGGTGNLWGSLVGAAVLVILPELLKFVDMSPDVADKMRQIIYGLILIGILRIRPQGLFGEHATSPTLQGSDGEGARGAVPTGGNPAGQGEVTVRGEGLSKRFGGIVAVQQFNIELVQGRITGLIGPNGAGKTTAFNLITGFLKPNTGHITLRGMPVTGLRPHRVVQRGMARSFQDLRLFTRMQVIENILVALPNQAGDNIVNVFLRPGLIRRQERENYARAVEIARFVGLQDKIHERAEDLSYAEEKLLVIARLLATGAEVLLFDEPLSGLDPTTLDEIFPVIRKLAESGKTVCIIEHNLDVIKSLCDVVVFLDEGRNLASGTPDELMSDPVLAERYFK